MVNIAKLLIYVPCTYCTKCYLNSKKEYFSYVVLVLGAVSTIGTKLAKNQPVRHLSMIIKLVK